MTAELIARIARKCDVADKDGRGRFTALERWENIGVETLEVKDLRALLAYVTTLEGQRNQWYTLAMAAGFAVDDAARMAACREICQVAQS